MPSVLTRFCNKTMHRALANNWTRFFYAKLKFKLFVIDRKHWTAMYRSITLQFVMICVSLYSIPSQTNLKGNYTLSLILRSTASTANIVGPSPILLLTTDIIRYHTKLFVFIISIFLS